MSSRDVTVVVGACGPERQRLARALATESSRVLIPAGRLTRETHPIEAAAAAITDAGAAAGVVVEFDATTAVTEVIGTLTSLKGAAGLTGVVCVVDALHLLDDLAVDDFVVTEVDADGTVLDCTARALLTVTQMEFASVVIIVNWEVIATRELSMIMALVSHLSPLARLRLDGTPTATVFASAPYRREQERAGWIGVLNGDAEPHMTDPRVSAIRYEHLRPLHPGRLQAFLDRVEAGAYGQVLRSAGFCRFATRTGRVLYWDHVGSTIEFREAVPDDHHPERDDGDFPAPGQELAFIGIDLDPTAIRLALDAVALSDAEFTAGPGAWAAYSDPFPRPAEAPQGD